MERLLRSIDTLFQGSSDAHFTDSGIPEKKVRDIMAKKRTVALFGDTLLMDSVEASLSSQNELGLVRVNTQVANVVEHLRKLRPDLIIFDGDDPQSKFVVPFLQVQSSIPLLCLNGSRNTVVALTAQHFTAQSASDLTRTIQGRVLAAAAT